MRALLAALFVLAAFVPAEAQGPPTSPPYRARFANFAALATADAGVRQYISANALGMTTTAANRRMCRYVTLNNKTNMSLSIRVYSPASADKVNGYIVIAIEPGDAWNSNGIPTDSIWIVTTGFTSSLYLTAED